MTVSDLLRRRNVRFTRVARCVLRCARRKAGALQAQGRQIAKSVLLRADHGYCYLLAVLPADKTIDLSRLSRALGGSRFEVATRQEMTQLCPGCRAGTLPPFGSEFGVHTVVEESLAAHAEIVFGANGRREAVRMGFDEYRRSEQPLVLRFASEAELAL